jgi:hypothetical protein
MGELFEHEINGTVGYYTPAGTLITSDLEDTVDLLEQMGRDHAGLRHQDIPAISRQEVSELIALVTAELLRLAEEEARAVNASRKPREPKAVPLPPYALPVVRVVDVLRPLDELGVRTQRRTVLTYVTRTSLDLQAFADALIELALAQEVETEPVS